MKRFVDWLAYKLGYAELNPTTKNYSEQDIADIVIKVLTDATLPAYHQIEARTQYDLRHRLHRLVASHTKIEVSRLVAERISGEQFIDEIVERIRKKQL